MVLLVFPAGLSYCRHLKTVRTHLSGLVNTTIISVEDPERADASAGLTKQVWNDMEEDGVVSKHCVNLPMISGVIISKIGREAIQLQVSIVDVEDVRFPTLDYHNKHVDDCTNHQQNHTQNIPSIIT